jgi:tetratricopeptide (TPR) repeat protein
MHSLKRGEQNTVAEILARLEADPVELREQVLAEALLAQIDKPLEEMLRRGLVFELPVPREAIAAVCEGIPNLDGQINRAVALGLLEVSPDKSLRVPRILPLKLPEDAESLHKHAAEVLYRLWWEEGEEGESLRGEQGLEIHRLALLGKAEKIATEMAVALTSQGHNQSLFKEVVQLCQLTLGVAENYRILHQLARSEQELGEVSQAQEHYQQALNNCPQENEKEKAAIIHNLATLKANQGHIKEALALYKQSEIIFERIPYDPGKAGSLHCQGILEAKQGHIEEAITLYEQSKVIFDSIGCDQGKARALHCLGMCKAAQAKVEEAITLYQKSLVLFESLGDDQGKAATLHELATLKTNMEEIDQAIALYQQSLEIKEGIGDAQGKAITLGMLGQLLANGKGDFETARDYLQQSLEILQRLESPDAEIARQALARVQQMAGDRG